jgi:hypothetical protein
MYAASTPPLSQAARSDYGESLLCTHADWSGLEAIIDELLKTLRG